MDTFLQRPNRLGGRNLGTLRSSGFTDPTRYGWDQKPILTGDTPQSTVSTYTPRPLPRLAPGVAPAPTASILSRTGADFLSSIGASGVSGGRPVGSTGGVIPMGASDESAYAKILRPAYNPPQQTERANPLTGANNYPMESTSVVAQRPPFVQRGGLPTGRDAIPSPIKETITEDEDIGRSMRGTYGRLRDVMGRRFGQPSASPAAVLARAQIY